MECPVANGRACGNHGVCTASGCRCDKQWKGRDCTLPAEVCPDDFHCFHGRCNAEGACECAVGYAGADCSIGPMTEEDCQGGQAGSKACMMMLAAA